MLGNCIDLKNMDCAKNGKTEGNAITKKNFDCVLFGAPKRSFFLTRDGDFHMSAII